MRLSKIKLSGFKSFVDSTTIAFPGNLMAIVGPNGCGKSNIIDAVRWVLGESSAKTLRGDSMADVIFNGSSVRKPVGRASVELMFNNADGTLGGPYAGYSEVAVRRVVSRDGTSKYYLNNSRCRRKDITHMLLGTGLGSHGYSIIEQGMISRLVEAKPEELRAFLEEAAGISKYKERRRETGHRIRRTRENLERLSDLREEIGKQISHLQRQARGRRAVQVTEGRGNGGWRPSCWRCGYPHCKRTTTPGACTGTRSRPVWKRRWLISAPQRHRSKSCGWTWTSATSSTEKCEAGRWRWIRRSARLEQSLEHRRKLRRRQKQDLEDIAGQLAQSQALSDSDRAAIQQVESTAG